MQTLFKRKGKNITTVATGAVQHFDSNNKAKQASHKLQKANGGLGAGSLVVA